MKVGTTVKVINDEGAHTWTGSSWDSGNLNPQDTYSFTFNTPGTYNYICEYHADAPLFMKGTVTVTA